MSNVFAGSLAVSNICLWHVPQCRQFSNPGKPLSSAKNWMNWIFSNFLDAVFILVEPNLCICLHYIGLAFSLIYLQDDNFRLTVWCGNITFVNKTDSEMVCGLELMWNRRYKDQKFLNLSVWKYFLFLQCNVCKMCPK